jgi:hypothetical protein
MAKCAMLRMFQMLTVVADVIPVACLAGRHLGQGDNLNSTRHLLLFKMEGIQSISLASGSIDDSSSLVSMRLVSAATERRQTRHRRL